MAAVILAAIGGYFYVEKKRPVVTQYIWKSKNIPPAFDGFRILQLSDVHNIKIDENTIEQENTDIIVVTGDLIDNRGAEGVETINKIRSVAPVYFVPGNHEEWRGDYRDRREDIKDAGAILLEDMSTIITKDGQELVLTGVMDSDFSTMMVVSAGLGWTGIPLRIRNRAEFVSVTLKKTD